MRPNQISVNPPAVNQDCDLVKLAMKLRTESDPNIIPVLRLKSNESVGSLLF